MKHEELIDRCKLYVQNEPRDFIYRVATRLISQSWKEGDLTKISEGLGVLLLTWNSAFYRYGMLDILQLEKCIEKWYRELGEYRLRDIRSLTSDDDIRVPKIFDDFEEALSYRTKKGKKRRSGVSVAKALHLIAPKFFPLWDVEIAKAKEYKCGKKDASAYMRFMSKIKNKSEEILEDFVNKKGGTKEAAIKEIWNLHPQRNLLEKPKTLVKLIDEYNYVVYTLPKRKR